MKGRTSWIGLLIACSIGVCSGAAAAQPAAPPARYKIDEKYTQKSPDKAHNEQNISGLPPIADIARQFLEQVGGRPVG
jgi:hypothetical protein